MTVNTDRFDAAMRYLTTYSPALRIHVDAALNGNITAENAGALISLKDDHVMGSENKRLALRALLLCQRAFLNAPYSVGAGGAPFIYNTAPRSPIEEYRWSFESTIRSALACYMTVGGATCADLAAAAAALRGPRGLLTWETLHRTTAPFPNMPVCFDALKMLLFKAGLVSIRWLASTGPAMTAQTVNQMLGDGVVVLPAALAAMPVGYLFNFHRQGDQAVCHWGVSLGNGWAAGANTHSNWPGAPGPVPGLNATESADLFVWLGSPAGLTRSSGVFSRSDIVEAVVSWDADHGGGTRLRATAIQDVADRVMGGAGIGTRFDDHVLPITVPAHLGQRSAGRQWFNDHVTVLVRRRVETGS